MTKSHVAAGPESRPHCLTRPRKTAFVEIFRTTPVETVCPNFYVLSHANGCLFSPHCSYCYLKSSLWHLDQQEAFSNIEKLQSDVRAWLERDDLESYVLNSGNLSDSLVFEGERPLMPRLVELFRQAQAAGKPHMLLLVTKGGMRECRPLLEVAPCANVVASFSLNCPEAAQEYEGGAATAHDRLAAAAALKRAGWRVRIRIDPMIAGFDYTWLAQQVRDLSPERVTLGCLRAEANLHRFVEPGIFEGLAQPAKPKGMSRYPKPQRLAMYRAVIEVLSSTCPIGLCEETPDIWADLGLNADAKPCNCGG